MKKLNVLIFPAGEVISVELHAALSTCMNINLFGASSINRHGEYIFKNYISGLPLIEEDNFIEEFNKILRENAIDIIFPTHDDVVKFFADNQDKIASKLIIPDKRTAEICRNKELIYKTFKSTNILPKLYSKITEYPVFIKPKIGQGGVGAKLIKNESDIPKNINLVDYIISEYLPGYEYSVDCLTDKNGKLIFISPRSRNRTMAGICVEGEIVELTDEMRQIAEILNKRLSFHGFWFFQVKKDINEKCKLLEVAARCASTMCLSRARGVNLPLLSIYINMGLDVSVISNPYNIKMGRTLISRYQIDYDYDTVYFDFDDTLIIQDKVHLPAINFLYQCKNLGKKIILLTKHEKELDKSIKKYAISPELFDKITHIKMDANKSDYITQNKNAIFVDNSFLEREAVFNKHNIPVFDVDGLEVLLDWKM